jgi:hypothetical protein
MFNADRQTDMTKLIVAFSNFANEPNNIKYFITHNINIQLIYNIIMYNVIYFNILLLHIQRHITILSHNPVFHILSLLITVYIQLNCSEVDSLPTILVLAQKMAVKPKHVGF